MSFDAMKWAAKQEPNSSITKLVLLMLADRVDKHGRCWPSLNRIAKDCLLSRRTVINAIKSLERDGLITVVRRSEDGASQSNYYVLSCAKDGSETQSPLVHEFHQLVHENHQGGAGNSTGGSASDAPKPINIEPINEPISEPINNMPPLSPKEKKRKASSPSKEIYRSFKHLSITVEEVEKIQEDLRITRNDIDAVLDDIENYAKNKNYTSLNLTARKWLKKRIKEGEIEPIPRVVEVKDGPNKCLEYLLKMERESKHPIEPVQPTAHSMRADMVPMPTLEELGL